MRKNLHAFTLIELLVTIAIIGILSVISLVATNSVREAGRDAKRKTDLETIRSALELYHADCGSYPTTALFPQPGSSLNSTCGGGSKTYLVSMPDDPTTGRDYRYNYLPASGTYYLCTALEGSSGGVNCDAGTGTTVTCGTGVNCNYETNNP